MAKRAAEANFLNRDRELHESTPHSAAEGRENRTNIPQPHEPPAARAREARTRADQDAPGGRSKPEGRERHGHDFTTSEPALAPIVAIGGSSGALAILRQILRGIEDGFSGAILIVLHVGANSPGLLPEMLQPRTEGSGIDVVYPAHGEVLVGGRAYVAPPDRHLLVERSAEHGVPARLRLTRGPRENRHRPAIDPMFRSVARTFGPRAVGIILSGQLDDGAGGMFAIQSAGGKTIVQDPQTAEYADMPQNALREIEADWVLEGGAIAAKINEFANAMRPAGNGAEIPNTAHRHLRLPLTCPECGGALLQYGGEPNQLRCRVGHAYGLGSLAAEYSSGVESALWVAMRVLREKADLARRLQDRASSAQSRQKFLDQAAIADSQADAIRDMIEHLTSLSSGI